MDSVGVFFFRGRGFVFAELNWVTVVCASRPNKFLVAKYWWQNMGDYGKKK
jgi:hypothetical protein